MPRKPANPKNETPEKKRVRRKKNLLGIKPEGSDDAPQKRGRKPKNPGLVLQTTLQVGNVEFDISALAEKAYKEYKRVHKRKIVTDFHVYVKPEEGVAYYTVNGEGSEEFYLALFSI